MKPQKENSAWFLLIPIAIAVLAVYVLRSNQPASVCTPQPAAIDQPVNGICK
jgi:hypothetical protein